MRTTYYIALSDASFFLNFSKIIFQRAKLLQIIYPTEEFQIHTFDRLIDEVSVLQDRSVHLKKRIEDLFYVLLNRAFTGDLTASWREAHMKKLLQEMEWQSSYLEKMK